MRSRGNVVLTADEIRRQHAEIEDLAQDIEQHLSPAVVGANPVQARALLNGLLGRIWVHCLQEDELGGDPGEISRSEFDGLSAKWTDDLVGAYPGHFCDEVRAFLKRLRARIRAEEVRCGSAGAAA